MIEPPQTRPGLIRTNADMPRVVVFFRNSAAGNAAIQLLLTLGLPADALGVTPPEQIGRGQGMVLSIAYPSAEHLRRVEAVCRGYGAEIHYPQSS